MGTGGEQKPRERRESERGAVLMETVIAIPLYMIMLGGIFWIGDLTLTRQQLVIADRYVAWNKGVRYDDRGQTDAGALHSLFFSDKYGVPSKEHTPTVRSAAIDADFDWSQRANGQVSVKATMPNWVYAMIHAATIQYNSGQWMQDHTELYGREVEGNRHVVLMRTKREAQAGYIRNKYGVHESSEVSDKWKDLANEKWPYE